MSDNITAPAAGAILATDDIGGVHFPRTKVSFGDDGSASDVSATNPLPVTAIGAATATKQDELVAAIANLLSASSWFAITPADSALGTVPDAIYVGGAGNLVARGSDGADATFVVSAGQTLPIRPTQVRAASTATGIIGLVN